MSVQATINAGLIAHLKTMVGLPEVAYPNTGYRPTPNQQWLQVDFLPGEPNQVTLGADGYDLHVGLLQVTCVVPEGVGEQPALQLAGTVAEHFRRGTVVSHGGLLIRVPRPPATLGGSREAPWYRVPVRVPYRAEVN